MGKAQYPVMPQDHADTAPAQAGRKTSVAGYRVLAVLAFLLAAGGLFIGLLTGSMPWVTTPGTGALAGSLLGYLIAYFQEAFSSFSAFHTALFSAGEILPLVEYAAVILLCLTLVLSLIFLLVALFTRKGAKGCALASSVLVLIVYAMFFALWACTLTLSGSKTPLPIFGGSDMGIGCIAIAMLIALFVADVVRKRAAALLDLGCVLLLAATVFALIYPGSLMLTADVSYARLGQDAFVNIAAYVVALLVIYNLLHAALNFGTRGCYVLDCIRYCLLFAAAIVFIVALGVRHGADALFSAANLPPLILAAVAPLTAGLASLIAAILRHTKRANAKETARLQAAVAAEQAQQQSQQQPVAPVYTMPVFAMPMTMPQQSAASAPEPQPATAPAPALAAAEEPPMSAFERDMIALASAPANESTQTFTSTAAYPYTSAYQPAPQPAMPMPQMTMSQMTMSPTAASLPGAAAMQQNAAADHSAAPINGGQNRLSYMSAAQPLPVIDPTPYIYDAFISSLTPQEKNEFGDLFIANKYGDLNYLPPYIIGGDNIAFFKKIFIYLGKFRDHISAPLLNKLYLYVSGLK